MYLRHEPAARKLFGGLTSANCAVSPDGKLVAAQHDSGQTILFECQGEIAKKHEYHGQIRPIASQDGRWFLIAGRRFSTDTWQPGVSLSEDGVIASLSSDGAWYLTQRSDGLIGLGDTATGALQARFEWKNPVHDAPPFFSPGGQYIVFWSKWDVVAIDVSRVRAGLQELGLDWQSRNEDIGRQLTAPPQGVLGGEPNEHRSSGDLSVAPRQNEDSSTRVQLAPELASIHTIDELSGLVDDQALVRSQVEPNNPRAAFDAAMVAIDRRDFTLALGCLNRSCQLLPDAITPRLWRAYVFAAMRDYPRAIEDANGIIDRKGASSTEVEQMAERQADTGPQYFVPDSHEAPIEEDFRLLRAEWQYRAKQYEAAIADCSRLIRIGGQRWAQYAYGLRAACYEAMNERKRAQSDQARFLELTHIDAKTLNMAAGPMSGRDISLRQPTITLRLVRKLLSFGVELDENTENTIGCVLFQNDLYEEAAQWIEQCLRQGEGRVDGFDLYVLAMAYHRLGKTEIAQQCAARAESWQPIQPLDYRDRRNLETLRHEWRKVSNSQQGIEPVQ